MIIGAILANQRRSVKNNLQFNNQNRMFKVNFNILSSQFHNMLRAYRESKKLKNAGKLLSARHSGQGSEAIVSSTE